ncbi:MAG: hypothetical protein ABMB14_20845, partial [Myxococcota bacterium]
MTPWLAMTIVLAGVAFAEPDLETPSTTSSDADDGGEVDGPDDDAAAFLDAVGAPDVAVTEGRRPLGLELGTGVASAYAYRGLDLFEGTATDPAMLVAPRLVLSRGDWSGGVFASLQATGSQAAALIRAGVGLEQNAFVGYSRGLSDRVSVDAALTGTFFPWATAADAGTRLPVVVEPLVTLTVDVGIELAATVSQLHGIQHAQIEGDYTYGGLAASRSFPLGPTASVDVGG